MGRHIWPDGSTLGMHTCCSRVAFGIALGPKLDPIPNPVSNPDPYPVLRGLLGIG